MKLKTLAIIAPFLTFITSYSLFATQTSNQNDQVLNANRSSDISVVDQLRHDLVIEIVKARLYNFENAENFVEGLNLNEVADVYETLKRPELLQSKRTGEWGI